MTCIAAIETRHGVTMAGDRAGSNGWTRGVVDTPKVFTNGPLLIGYTSSFRMGQLLQHALHPPVHTLGWDIDWWITHDLMNTVRRTFSEHGWGTTKDQQAAGGNWLVAVAGRCYEIQTDYSWLRYTTGRYTVGSGEVHAAASLATTAHLDLDPATRLQIALEVTADAVGTVHGPWDIHHQEKP